MLTDSGRNVLIAILSLLVTLDAKGCLSIFFSEQNIIIFEKHKPIMLFFCYCYYLLSIIEKNYSKDIEKYKKQEEIIQNSMGVLFKGYLCNILSTFKCKEENNLRISIYHYSEIDKKFVMIARYSKNPKFDTPGRGYYDENEGIIAQGWQTGWAFINLGKKSKNEIINIFKNKYKIQEPENLSMLSRQLASIRLSLDQNGVKKVIGVLVVESIESNCCKEKDLIMNLKKHIPYISYSMWNFKEFLPTPNKANKIELEDG